ncbi:DUF1534 domain-containing protein, partial [Pseudomonas syringae]|uniref:DUF1534 domain-containing protein n=1 Tax=Pseudomonas syringae TaxID=317 RepID=UPI001F37EC03
MNSTEVHGALQRISFRTLQRGNAVLDAPRRQEDAERPEKRYHAERGSDNQSDFIVAFAVFSLRLVTQ